MGKNSIFSTYILHLDIFSNSICIQCQATALPAASSAPASPGNTPGAGWGRTGGPFSSRALSEPWGYWLLLISAMPVFFRVLFTSSSATTCFQQFPDIVSTSLYHPLPVQIIVWFLLAGPRLIPLASLYFWGAGTQALKFPFMCTFEVLKECFNHKLSPGCEADWFQIAIFGKNQIPLLVE